MPDPIYFSKVKLLDGSYAEVKDAVARAAIGGATHFIGVTTTALSDGLTISQVTIGSETVTLANGDLMLYGSKEFIFSSADGKVHELGDTTGLGALAYKDTASGNFTPQGEVSKPDITVTPTTATIKEIDGAGSVTPGSANVPTAVSVTPGSANTPTAVSVTPGSAGTAPSWGCSVSGEILEFSWNAGAVGTPTQVSVTPGTAGTPTAVSVTPGTAGTPTAVTLPTSKETSVMTGASAALDNAPVFTGTQGTVSVS